MSNPAEFRKWVANAIGRRPEDFGPGDLQWIANGPLYDPSRLSCPAGRLSWAETKAREAEQVIRA